MSAIPSFSDVMQRLFASGPEAPGPLGLLLDGPNREKLERREAAFRQRVAHRLRTRSLDHLKAGALIGEGGAKKAYELPVTDCVLVVDGAHGAGLLDEIVNLHQLSAVEMPVVELRDLGCHGGRQAMVMERLHDVTKPSPPDTFSGKAFVTSRFATRRTIDSLVRFRDAIVEQRIDVIDLQYGFRKDGSLRVFDLLSILSCVGGIGNTPVVKTLDQLVAALGNRFAYQRLAA